MSLYNALFGQNADAEKLVAILTHLDPSFAVPRFRDCYFDGEHIVVHTRTGGGNRDSYEAENDAMARHPWYVRDEDDDFDSTFADFYFKPTPEIAATLTAATDTPTEKWQNLFAALDRGEKPANAVKVAEQIVPAITKALDEGAPGTVITI